jgi:hypothetical protein
VLVHAEAVQELARARLRDAERRAELKRLEVEAARASEPAVRDTVGSTACRVAPAALPTGDSTGDAADASRSQEGQARLMRTETGVEELVLRLKALIQMRTLLERSGAPGEEIEKRTAEINRVRLRLAEHVRESADDYGSAA